MKTDLFSFTPSKNAFNCVTGLAKRVVKEIQNSEGIVKSVQFLPIDGSFGCAILAEVPEDFKPSKDTGFS